MKGDDFEKSQPRRVAYALAEKYDFPSKYLDNDLLEHLQSIPAHTIVDDTDMEYAGFWWPHPDNYASDSVLPIDFLKEQSYFCCSKIKT